MKTVIRVLLIIAAATAGVRAEGQTLPPEQLRANWQELHKLDFADWKIRDYLGWSIPFDGGSKVFFFESDEGERFDLMAANPAYWTEQDRKKHRQVFFVIHKNRFYRITPKSKNERCIIKKLTDAAARLSGGGRKNPKLLRSLARHLESRKPIFKTKDKYQ